MALQVEGVVDGGVDAEESLCGAGRFEPLHFPLPSPHNLVRVLGAIVRAQPLLVTAGQTELPERGGIGVQLVGNRALRRKARHCHGNRVGRAAYRVRCRDGSALLPPSSLPARANPTHHLAVSLLHPGYRDVEELLAERGLDISYETVRRWVLKFGPVIARRLRQRRPRPSNRWHRGAVAAA